MNPPHSRREVARQYNITPFNRQARHMEGYETEISQMTRKMRTERYVW